MLCDRRPHLLSHFPLLREEDYLHVRSYINVPHSHRGK